MESKAKKIVLGIIALFISFAAYQLLFGKLFPYSPITIGFSKHELANSIIYVQNGVKFRDYETIDTLIPLVEDFHDLKFIRDPEIFVFRDSLSYIHHSPTKARFCAFSSGRLIISPWALRENEVRLDVEYRITFMYSEFACIVDYLVERYGKGKLLMYMKSLIRSNDHDRIFKQVYGIDFDAFLQEFRQSLEIIGDSEIQGGIS